MTGTYLAITCKVEVAFGRVPVIYKYIYIYIYIYIYAKMSGLYAHKACRPCELYMEYAAIFCSVIYAKYVFSALF